MTRIPTRKWLPVVAFLTILVSSLGTGLAEDRVRVFAAASLTPPLTEVLSKIDGTDGVFASSGTLARQILSGAPADIFISANSRWSDYLISEGAVRREDVYPYLHNTLVLVAAPGEAELGKLSADIAPILIERRLAIGDPDHVPAGHYARQALIATGLWPRLERNAVRAPSVRAALAFVERGAAGYGIVYASDAATSGATVQQPIPAHLHDPIIYTISLLRDSPAARHVLQTLKGATSQATLAQFGFTLVPAE